MNFFEILSEEKVKEKNAIAVAFLGDAIHSLFVKEFLVTKHNSKSNKLHVLAIDFVSAKAQARVIDKIYDTLSEKEQAVCLRARNAHYGAMSKKCTIEEYHKATMLESLYGYLYLIGEKERLSYLLHESIK